MMSPYQVGKYVFSKSEFIGKGNQGEVFKGKRKIKLFYLYF